MLLDNDTGAPWSWHLPGLGPVSVVYSASEGEGLLLSTYTGTSILSSQICFLILDPDLQRKETAEGSHSLRRDTPSLLPFSFVTQANPGARPERTTQARA